MENPFCFFFFLNCFVWCILACCLPLENFEIYRKSVNPGIYLLSNREIKKVFDEIIEKKNPKNILGLTTKENVENCESYKQELE